MPSHPATSPPWGSRCSRAATSRAGREGQLQLAIVNHRFAQHFFPGTSGAVGRHVGVGAAVQITKLDMEIVGVVADSLYEGHAKASVARCFVPNWGKRRRALSASRTAESTSADAYSRDPERSGSASTLRCRCMSSRRSGAQLDEITADRSAYRAALGRLRSAGDPARVGRPLRRDGVRGGSAAGGARRPAGAGRGAGCVVWLVMKEVLLLLAIGLAIGVPAGFASGGVVSQLYGIKARDLRTADRDRCSPAACRRIRRRGPDSGAARGSDRPDTWHCDKRRRKT